MGNLYVKPQRLGTSPFTRSGVPPPKLNNKATDPAHRHNDAMSLELHMKDQRARTRGLTDAEREWRKKYVLDQKIHPDEPIHVECVSRQLNPIRILYRYPWDFLFKRFLYPTFGVYYGTAIRQLVPKLLMGYLFALFLYYQYKYNSKSWQAIRGIGSYAVARNINTQVEVEEAFPGILEKGMPSPKQFDYFPPDYKQRTTHLQVADFGQTARPW